VFYEPMGTTHCTVDLLNASRERSGRSASMISEQFRIVRQGALMRPDIHPEYRQVIFEDSTGGQRWLTRSTITTDRTTTWDDGQEYPHILLDISMYTHPFYTGQMKIIDSAGRVERFNKRYGQRSKKTS